MISPDIEPPRKGLPPLVSSHRRFLETELLGYGEANIEYTLPASGEFIYLDPIVQRDERLLSAVTGLARVIIVPNTARRLLSARKEDVVVLSSQMECGRVLEADHQAEIDGELFDLNAKGGGATAHAREIIPLLHGTSRGRPLFNPGVPFYQQIGLLPEYAAQNELATAISFGQKGIDAERVLALFQLDQLPDQNGYLQSIEHFEKQGLIRDGLKPTILIRALKSNIRLLDVTSLGESGDKASFTAFVNFIVNDYGRRQNIDDPAVQGYLLGLTQTLLSQETKLVLEGYAMSDGRAATHKRNISVYGEQIDLENVRLAPDVFQSPTDYLANVLEYTNLTKLVLLDYMHTLDTVYDLDKDVYLDHVLAILNGIVGSTDFAAIYEGFQQTNGIPLDKFVEIVSQVVLQAPNQKMLTEAEELFNNPL